MLSKHQIKLYDRVKFKFNKTISNGLICKMYVNEEFQIVDESLKQYNVPLHNIICIDPTIKFVVSDEDRINCMNLTTSQLRLLTESTDKFDLNIIYYINKIIPMSNYSDDIALKEFIKNKQSSVNFKS